MFATDAIAELIANFRLERVATDPRDNPEYDFDSFDGGFAFTATELDDTQLQLTAALAGLPDPLPPALARRLLEAGLNGAETGAGQIGRHPTLGVALIEVIDCGPLDQEGFQIRFVDFVLHAEYWRSEGVARTQAETSVVAPADEPDAMTFRL